MLEPTEKISDLASLVELKANKNGSRTAVFFENRKISYVELDEKSTQMANSLRRLGVERSDRIASMMFNCPEVLYLWFAAAKLRAIYIPLNPALKGEILRSILNNCQPKLLFVDSRIFQNPQEECRHLTEAKVVTFNSNSDYSRGVATTFHELLTGTEETSQRLEILPREPATMMYTSGTTGVQKGAVLPHYAYLNLGIEMSRISGASATDVFFAPLPLFHTSGQVMSTIPAFLNDLPVVHVERFHASKFWAIASRFDATIIFLLSSMSNILFNVPSSPEDRNHKVRVALTGGIPKGIWRPFEQRFGVQVVEGFGMTETCGVAIFNQADKVRHGSVGMPLTNLEARVVGDAGKEVGFNVTGELQLRETTPYTTMLEYYRNPDETACFRTDGWMRTGDVVYRDRDGYYYYVERKKDLIRVRGENVSPLTIENALMNHPSILEAVAVAVPSQVGDDEIKVAIKLRDRSHADILELSKWLERIVPYYMVPRYWEFVENLPKTESQKPQRFLIKASGIEKSVDLYALGHKPKGPSESAATGLA